MPGAFGQRLGGIDVAAAQGPAGAAKWFFSAGCRLPTLIFLAAPAKNAQVIT
jgi:hypothetical protein